MISIYFFFFNDTATTEIYTLSLHDALPISVVTTGTDHAIEQIVKRVDKQVCVLKALDVTDLRHAEREIAVVSVKLNAGPALREVLQLVAQNRLKLVDVSQDTLTLEATGGWAAIDRKSVV